MGAAKGRRRGLSHTTEESYSEPCIETRTLFTALQHNDKNTKKGHTHARPRSIINGSSSSRRITPCHRGGQHHRDEHTPAHRANSYGGFRRAGGQNSTRSVFAILLAGAGSTHMRVSAWSTAPGRRNTRARSDAGGLRRGRARLMPLSLAASSRRRAGSKGHSCQQRR